MKTFLVPALPGETVPEYQMRVSSMAWNFVGERALTILNVGAVSLDGDQPDDTNFTEVPYAG